MERVTITIDGKVLSEIDGLIKADKAKNRSHAIGLLLRKGLYGAGIRNALVLAGGNKDAILVPGQKEIKPLIEVAGKTVLERILSSLKANGITRAVVCIGYGGEEIVAKFKNGEEIGMQLDYVSEESPAGSAGAMKLVDEKFGETFVLSYSDVLYDGLDLDDMLRFHRSTGALCTLALTNVNDPTAFGVAKLTGPRIVAFTEKPSASQSNLVNAGVAVCEPEIFGLIKKEHASFEKDLLPAIAERDKLYGYVYSGPWFDVGKPEHLEEAKKHFSAKGRKTEKTA